MQTTDTEPEPKNLSKTARISRIVVQMRSRISTRMWSALAQHRFEAPVPILGHAPHRAAALKAASRAAPYMARPAAATKANVPSEIRPRQLSAVSCQQSARTATELGIP